MEDPPIKKRSPKGSVSVEKTGAQIGLRWRYGGVQRRLPIGPDSPAMRIAAQRQAAIIAGDIATGNFDESLKKYRLQESTPSIRVVDLYDRYLSSKFGENRPTDKHKALVNHLSREFGSAIAIEVDRDDASEFLEGLNCKIRTQAEYRTILRECWRDLGKRYGLKDNPWDEVRLAREDDPPESDPFDGAEIAKILDAFEGHYYQGYVLGLIGTGARPGEVSALNWGDISFASGNWGNSPKDGRIKITKSWSDRRLIMGPTKTREKRTIPLEEGLQSYLESVWSEAIDPESPLFPSRRGGRISAKLFLRRHWIPILEQIGVRYRPQYNARNSRWSHEIDDGMSIALAAELAGNTVETMVRRYYGNTKKDPKMKNMTGKRSPET